MHIIPEVLEELEKYLQSEREYQAEQEMSLRSFFESCESPMEQKFLQRLIEYFPGYTCNWEGIHILSMGFCEPQYLGFDLRIYPQREIPIDLSTLIRKQGTQLYRADFLFRLTRWNHHIGTTESLSYLVIEIDGHNYHERTKNQATRDRSRDRILTAAGYSVFRFTGSELYRDMDKSIEEIQAFLAQRVSEFSLERDLKFY